MIVGIVVRGAFDSYMANVKEKDTDYFQALTIFIGFTVTLVWVILNLYSIIHPGFTVDLSTNGLMGLIVGAIFGKNIFKPQKK